MILQINFNLNVPVAEYQKMADSVAHAFIDVAGLRWKRHRRRAHSECQNLRPVNHYEREADLSPGNFNISASTALNT